MEFAQNNIFTIPYCAVSGVQAGIVRDYAHKVYYRTLIFTEGIIEKLSKIELQVVSEHEKSEMILVEEKATTGKSKGITTLEAEAKRHELELQRLYEKFGKGLVEKTLQK